MQGLETNFLNIGQMIEKNYKVLIKDKMMVVIDSCGRLVLKAPMSRNKIFNIEFNAMKHKCLEIAPSRDE